MSKKLSRSMNMLARPALTFESLEDRRLLSVSPTNLNYVSPHAYYGNQYAAAPPTSNVTYQSPLDIYQFSTGLGYTDPAVVESVKSITTTNSQVPITFYGEKVVSPGGFQISTVESTPLIDLNEFRVDPRFSSIDGSGFAAVILDTGIDRNHPFFGSDANSDGISDRIVYSYDFANNDADASDLNGHGSNVSSIVGSSDGTYKGMAPGADIIHLKVFTDNGSGNFGYVESALQWVVANAATYNIASVNMSLGDSTNQTTAVSLYGLGDELAALAAMNVIVVSASGNDFFTFTGAQGVSYPSADPNSLSVGAVYDSASSGFSYGSGASAAPIVAGQITPFSQRHANLTDIMAPGAPITGANQSGSIVTQHGTSQASPHIAGISVLAQQLATQVLGRRLTLAEMRAFLRSSATTINDGDDESDNVTNTGLNFPLVNVLNLGVAILDFAGTTSVSVEPIPDIVTASSTPLNIELTIVDADGVDVSQIGTGDIRVTGPNGYNVLPTFVSVDNNTNGSPRVATYQIVPPGGSWDAADNGVYTIEVLAGELSDGLGNAVDAQVIDTFQVDLQTLGPDGFGYKASRVPYSFQDISATGTLILAGADDASALVVPGGGFSFNFYGTNYTNVYISSNGVLSFGNGVVSFDNTNLASAPVDPSIAVFWDDLIDTVNKGVYWQLFGADDRQELVVQWETAFYSDDVPVSFQLILKEYDKSARVNYRQIDGTNSVNGSSATVGIKGANTQGANRLLVAFNQADSTFLGNEHSFDFYLNGRAPLGLEVDNDSIAEAALVGDTVGLLSILDYDTEASPVFELVAGVGSDDNSFFSVVGSQLKVGATLDFESKQTYNIRVRVTDTAGFTYEQPLVIHVFDSPEFVAAPIIGSGLQVGVQHSMINKIMLTFDGDVDVGTDAFELIKRGPGGGAVGTNYSKSVNGLGQTEIIITFKNSFVRGNMNALVDGWYQLTIRGGSLTRNGVGVDVDQNGQAGGDLVIGSQESDNFFALFGDANGDGLVGMSEFGMFRGTYGKLPNGSNYNIIFDFDGLGVGISDFGSFRSRFGKPKIQFV